MGHSEQAIQRKVVCCVFTILNIIYELVQTFPYGQLHHDISVLSDTKYTIEESTVGRFYDSEGTAVCFT